MRYIKTLILVLIGFGPCACDTGGFWADPEPLGPSLLDGAVYPLTGAWEWRVESDACEAHSGLLAASDGTEQSDARQDFYDLESRFVDSAGNEVVFEGHVVREDITGVIYIMNPATGNEISATVTAVMITTEAPYVIQGELSEFVGADCTQESLPITIQVTPSPAVLTENTIQ
jgi:hypothetical protein